MNENLLIYGGGATFAALLAAWLFRAGDKLEEIRGEAISLGMLLSKYGWTILADIVLAFVKRDLSGAAHKIREALDLLRDEKRRRAHFREVFLTTWSEMLATWPDEDLAPFVTAFQAAAIGKTVAAETRKRIAEATTATAAQAKADAAAAVATP
jgi:hypothetical protein